MRRFVLLLALGLGACAKPPIYTAPILVEDLSAQDLAGQTRCSVNNLPVSHVDLTAWSSVAREFIIVHEQKHALDMKRHKGGCWAFLYRYNEDKKFAMDSEYAAYCLEGQLALQRNVNPKVIWERIENALIHMDAGLAKRYKNCIY